MMMGLSVKTYKMFTVLKEKEINCFIAYLSYFFYVITQLIFDKGKKK